MTEAGPSSTSQLGLFEGPHVPRTAARAALARGQLAEASALLAPLGASTPEAADAARLERIHASFAAARDVPVQAVHAGFAAALAQAVPRDSCPRASGSVSTRAASRAR